MIQTSYTDTLSGAAFLNTWQVLLAGDEGAPISGAQYTDKSMQVSGIFGGASVSLQGSNDGVNWSVLHDTQGNSLTASTSKLAVVAEATRYVKPVVTGGDGTTSLTVTILMKE